MSAANLAVTGAFIRQQEGGFADDPRDPGGATFEGVTLAVLRAWRHAPKLGVAALRAITAAQWDALFAARYWQAIGGDALPSGVDLMCADFAFNVGARAAAKLLQTTVGVAADGYIGPATLERVAYYPPARLLSDLSISQQNFYEGCLSYWCFGMGWDARTIRRYAAASKLVTAVKPAPSEAAIS